MTKKKGKRGGERDAAAVALCYSTLCATLRYSPKVAFRDIANAVLWFRGAYDGRQQKIAADTKSEKKRLRIQERRALRGMAMVATIAQLDVLTNLFEEKKK